MNLPLLDIPDDPRDWPAWLESQIVGPELGELAEQLSVVLNHANEGTALEKICGSELSQVFQCGLSVLSTDQLRQLLRHPHSLLKLQEQVLACGSEYWSVRIASSEPVTAGQQRWEQLQPLLRDPPSVLPTVPSGFAWWTRRRVLAAAGSLAVVTLIGVRLWRQEQRDVPWGWNRPDVFATDLLGDAYLKHLSGAAAEWFLQPRNSKSDLERQLIAFRSSCEKLLDAPHTQLSEDQRNALLQRCRNWIAKLDGHLADLRGDEKPPVQVKVEADQTAEALVTALANGLA